MPDFSMPIPVAKQIRAIMDKMYITPPDLAALEEVRAIPHLTWTEKITYLGYKLHDPKLMAKCPITHRFDPGVYVRTTVLPKGHLFIGRVHKHGHIVRLIAGSAVLIEEHGKQIKEAYSEMITPPGYQTVAYLLTDVIAQSLHPNPREIRDVQVLEDEYFVTVPELLAEGARIDRRLIEEA